MEKFKEKMGLSPEHILEAQKIAEGLYKKPPHIQTEMVSEIKKSLKKRHKATLELIDTL